MRALGSRNYGDSALNSATQPIGLRRKSAVFGGDSVFRTGAPRSTKMGTIRSLCPYDAPACHALRSAKPRRRAILRYASCAAASPIFAVVRHALFGLTDFGCIIYIFGYMTLQIRHAQDRVRVLLAELPGRLRIMEAWVAQASGSAKEARRPWETKSSRPRCCATGPTSA